MIDNQRLSSRKLAYIYGSDPTPEKAGKRFRSSKSRFTTNAGFNYLQAPVGGMPTFFTCRLFYWKHQTQHIPVAIGPKIAVFTPGQRNGRFVILV